VTCACPIFCSVKHSYDRWEDTKTKLLTCNPNTRTYVTPSQDPQELLEDQEVVFTYDVSFQVASSFEPLKFV